MEWPIVDDAAWAEARRRVAVVSRTLVDAPQTFADRLPKRGASLENFMVIARVCGLGPNLRTFQQVRFLLRRQVELSLEATWLDPSTHRNKCGEPTR